MEGVIAMALIRTSVWIGFYIPYSSREPTTIIVAAWVSIFSIQVHFKLRISRRCLTSTIKATHLIVIRTYFTWRIESFSASTDCKVWISTDSLTRKACGNIMVKRSINSSPPSLLINHQSGRRSATFTCWRSHHRPVTTHVHLFVRLTREKATLGGGNSKQRWCGISNPMREARAESRASARPCEVGT